MPVARPPAVPRPPRAGWLSQRRAVRFAARRAYARMRTGPSGLSRNAMAAVALIGGLAYALSYASLYDWAGKHNFGGPVGWESIAWPLTVDLASLATGITALDRALRSKGAALAATISAIAAGLMVIGNLADNSSEPAWLHPWVTAGMHAWPPVIALAGWYMYVRYRRDDARDIALLEDDSQQDEPEVAQDDSQPPSAKRPAGPKRVDPRVLRLARDGADWKRVATATGMKENAAKRALTEARKKLASDAQAASAADAQGAAA